MWHVGLPIAQIEINLLVLCVFGLGVGFLAGFFGVGGGFIMTPLLIALGVPPNVAVGSGLAIMLGASLSGTARHIQLGNVDFKLALILLAGTVAGVQIGAHALDSLHDAGRAKLAGVEVDVLHLCLGLCYTLLLFGVGVAMILESGRKTAAHADADGAMPLAKRLQELALYPRISLIGSGIEHYPLILLLLMGAFVGALAGLLGVGGGTIMMPMMIYLIGLRAQRAIGTDLCQICVTAATGAANHAFRGNVDPLLAGIVLVSALAGARMGASTTVKVKGLHLRFSFGVFSMIVGVVVCVTFVRKTFFLPG